MPSDREHYVPERGSDAPNTMVTKIGYQKDFISVTPTDRRRDPLFNITTEPKFNQTFLTNICKDIF